MSLKIQNILVDSLKFYEDLNEHAKLNLACEKKPARRR